MTEATAEKKDVVPSEYRDRYKATGGTNGDFIATALSKVADDGVEALATVKAENNIAADRWAGFNPGMQRMNLANVLRGSFLKGETITILGKEHNAKHMAEDFNGKLVDTDASLAKMAHYLGLVAKDQAPSDRSIAALRKLFFPPTPKGPTADERAATKAAKDAEKTAAKEAREKAKVEKTEAAAKAKQEKADKAAADKAEKVAKAEAEKTAKAEAKRIHEEAKAKAVLDKATLAATA